MSPFSGTKVTAFKGKYTARRKIVSDNNTPEQLRAFLAAISRVLVNKASITKLQD
jgi:hypothetical protein